MLLLALSAVLAGCGGSSESAGVATDGPNAVGPIPELVAMRRPPIDDLPVPIGFYLDDERSRNTTVAGARLIDHLYKGRADKFAVGRFYKQQMPISRWTLVRDRFAQGEVLQDYEKDTERCQISITDGGLFGSTKVNIGVWTSGGRIVPPAGVGSSRSSRIR
jgi:hypothetical protein